MKNKIFLLSFLIFALFSCKDKINTEDIPKSATLFFMAANNNLDSYLSDNVDQIVDNYIPSYKKDIFIYYKGKYGDKETPRLYQVKQSGSAQAYLSIVKEYGVDMNSASMESVKIVMDDLLSLENTTTIEDLVLSSHGGSWLPGDESPRVRGILQDNDYDNFIDIDVLAAGLEEYNLNSIIFDACFMSSIEVLYQLRNSAKYILASPAEVLARGMFYDLITPYFTQTMTKDVLSKMAEITTNSYKAESDISMQSATFLVTECKDLDELGIVVRSILDKYGDPQGVVDLTPILRYDDKYRHGTFLHDYKQVLYKLIGDNTGDKAELDAIWSKAFPHYYHTDMFFGYVDLNNSNGVGGYIYRDNEKKIINDYYKKLDWGKLVMN